MSHIEPVRKLRAMKKRSRAIKDAIANNLVAGKTNTPPPRCGNDMLNKASLCAGNKDGCLNERGD
ncbi:MAG: hypothetical protein Altm1KO_27950 [Alteromonas macleodii]